MTLRKRRPLHMRGPDRSFDRPRGPLHPALRNIKANAMPRPGDLRTAAISLSRGRIPQGSLLGNIVNSVGGFFRGSPVTGPTRAARISQAAAGPLSAARLSRPATPRRRPRRGGMARAM